MFSNHDVKPGDLSGSMEQIRQLLQTQEGQRLLQILNRDGGAAMRQAADSVRAGDLEAVKQQLGPLLNSEEAAQLLQKLTQK